jgi:GABA permease
VAATGFYFGAELVTVAAAEAAEPAKAIANATNSVIARVLIFYVGSILLIVAIVPWNRAEITTPYVSALKMMGVPAAAQIMNAVILTAVLSALNSGLYASSRILFALTKTGDAPSTLARVSRNGVPVRAILLGTVFGYGAILMSYISPDRVFAFLVNSYGTVALFVYLLIAVAHLRLRGRLERDKSHVLNAKMWGYPYLTYGAIIAMLTILTGMAFIPDQCLPLIMGVASLAAIALGYAVKRLSLSRPAARLTPPAGSHP